MSSSRRRVETGRFLPTINTQKDNSSSEFLPVPTPNSNPAEDSRIARPVDDDFDARVRASVTPIFTPMFDQILNRLEAMETRITARSNRTSPERDHPPSLRRSEFAYVDDRRRHVDHLPTLDDDESRIQRALKQLGPDSFFNEI
jgi:hypothetical protein